MAKTASKKIGALIRSMKFLSPEVALYLYKSTIRPRMEYFVISGLVPTWKSTTWYFTWFLLGIKLGTPDELHKRIYRTVGSSFAASLEPFAHCGNVAS